MGNSRSHENGRIWKLGKQAARRCNQNLKAKIKEKKKKLNAKFITSTLKCSPFFIGCYAENQLKNLTINHFPCFLIVNVDSSDMRGSHWLAIGLFTETIEIFDPLGFTIFNWARVPCDLLDFLHRMSVSRSVRVSPRIQSDTSSYCGFYCIFYILLRRFTVMRKIVSCFTTVFSRMAENDNVLIKFFR